MDAAIWRVRKGYVQEMMTWFVSPGCICLWRSPIMHSNSEHARDWRGYSAYDAYLEEWRTHACILGVGDPSGGLGENWDDTNVRHGFLFSISFFPFFLAFFLCLWLGPTCDRKKIEGKSQSMQELFILHDVHRCQQNGRWQHFSEIRRNENGGHNPTRNVMF